VEHQLKYMVEKELVADRVKLREQWLARMWNLSAFVQSVKQRFYASLRSPSAIWLCY
jgi:hypothetical protein